MVSSERAKELTAVELATLVVLEAAPAHGYEVARRLQATFGEIGRFSYGSIYPALARLARSGFIASVGAVGRLDPARLPGVLAAELVLAAGTAGGRSRRTYRITDEGRARLRTALEFADMADDRIATIALVASSLVAPETRRALLRGRRRSLVERLEELDRLEQEMPDLWLDIVRARTTSELAALDAAPAGYGASTTP